MKIHGLKYNAMSSNSTCIARALTASETQSISRSMCANTSCYGRFTQRDPRAELDGGQLGAI
jgi:hypothetical protein